MKNKSLLVLSTLALSLSSCSLFGSTKGVQAKSFVYSGCVSATAKTGTEEGFYNNNNFVGTDKETVANYLKNRLYDHGTYSTINDAIDFSQGTITGNKYNGKETTAYYYNYEEVDESHICCGGYYIPLNSDFTSIKLLMLDNSYDNLVDKVFELGASSEKRKYNDVSYTNSYRTSATDTSITYNETDKKLTVVLDVTFTKTENDITDTNVMTYTLEFTQKVI